METKNNETIDEVVNSVYPIWKKAAWVITGVAATVGLGLLANKFGWLPKGKVVSKVVENVKPVVSHAAKQVAQGATRVVSVSVNK